MPSRSDSPGSHKQPTGLFGSLRRREARSLGGHAPSGSFACLASPFMDWRGACGRRRRRRTRGSKSPFVRGARFAVLREEGMGYLVAILSRGRARQVVILSGAPPGAESKDPVRRQQKAPPSSTPSNPRSATRFGNGKASAAPSLGRDRTLCTIFSDNQPVISEKSLVGFCDSRAKSCIACDLCQGTEHVGLGHAMTVVKTLRESSSRRAIIMATPRKGVLL